MPIRWTGAWRLHQWRARYFAFQRKFRTLNTPPAPSLSLPREIRSQRDALVFNYDFRQTRMCAVRISLSLSVAARLICLGLLSQSAMLIDSLTCNTFLLHQVSSREESIKTSFEIGKFLSSKELKIGKTRAVSLKFSLSSVCSPNLRVT